MTGPTAALVVGVLLAALGGELFLRGLLNLAACWRVPPGLVGVTVGAFGTSAPELSVGVNSALAGRPEIVLGDVLGSNVVNIGLVLGVALLFGPVVVDRGTVSRDYPAAVAAPLVVGLLALRGALGPIAGLVLLVIFAAWLAQSMLAAHRIRAAYPAVRTESDTTSAAIRFGVGLTLLIAAGRAIVWGASGISAALGWDGFVVGAVLVALGTSAPELATVFVSRLRGHDEVAVGTLLGSNIFNTLLILGVAALIHPIAADQVETDIGIVAGVLLVLFIIPLRYRLSRWRSLPLLMSYGFFLYLLA